MKANVYVIYKGKQFGWLAFATIAIEADRLFWSDLAEKTPYEEQRNPVLLGERLPLDLACQAAELFNSGRHPEGEHGSAAEMLRSLAVVIQRAAGEGRYAHKSSWLSRISAYVSQWSSKGKNAAGQATLESPAGLIAAKALQGQGGWMLAADSRERGGTARGVERAPVQALAAAAQQAAAALQGRALLRGEAHALLEGTAPAAAGPAVDKDAALQLASLLGLIQLRSAVSMGASREAGWPHRGLRCLRCGSGEEQLHKAPCAACGREACAYCTACLSMGRSRECELLILGGAGTASSSAFKLSPPKQRLARWGLSPAQAAAAESALHFIERPAPSRSAYETSRVALNRTSDVNQTSFLLWAVTGAGKTEMTFPLVESILLRGGKALIATPRRDVVLELNPRIRRAFPKCSVVTLYGGSEQRWEQGDITLATTHQLLRFNQAFDLVILDELDAYPYHNDPQLHYAAEKSCSPTGKRVLLSATPPTELQRLARRGRLAHARVPVRFHRHPLPVPRLLRTPKVEQMLAKLRLPSQLQEAMLFSLKRGAQLFVFVQRISQVERMVQLLQKALKHLEVAGTSSQDKERADKVQRFRAGKIRILVTTTILERGVTIPRSDVFILDADGQLFDEASLVQMAGRAGRSSEDPQGNVIFCAKERTRSQMMAVHHIKKMNRIARAKGYIR
ncbi:helicase-related protein [Paenibacillus sp. KS-LC4]|uniref:DEAD/DEAH box helicase n=1 Tax=Paenibacillus sp. KS-LC4 TaxID=2979727 RepID=UPI0030CBF07D